MALQGFNYRLHLHSWGENYLSFLVGTVRKPTEVSSKSLMKIEFVITNQFSNSKC